MLYTLRLSANNTNQTERYGRLTVLSLSSRRSGSKLRTFALCLCDCGTQKEIRLDALKSGRVKSCKCLHNFVVSEKAKKGYVSHSTRLIRCWNSLMNRCFSPNSKSYKDYGARGITVCERWKNFNNFASDMGEPPKGFTLERKDNNGNYEPSNCIWASRLEQSNNQRGNVNLTYNNKTQTVSAWARELNINVHTLFSRLSRGITFEEAIKQ